MATAQSPKNTKQFKELGKPAQMELCCSAQGANMWQWYSMQVLLVLGLERDTSVLQTFPPGKLTSLEFNIIGDNEPFGLFELLSIQELPTHCL